jgi:hypothetical protein
MHGTTRKRNAVATLRFCCPTQLRVIVSQFRAERHGNQARLVITDSKYP